MVPSALKNGLPPVARNPARQPASPQSGGPSNEFQRELIGRRKSPAKAEDAPVRVAKGAKAKKSEKPRRAEEEAPVAETKKAARPAKAEKSQAAEAEGEAPAELEAGTDGAPQVVDDAAPDAVDAAVVAAAAPVVAIAADAAVATPADAEAKAPVDSETGDPVSGVATAPRPSVAEAGDGAVDLEALAALAGEAEEPAVEIAAKAPGRPAAPVAEPGEPAPRDNAEDAGAPSGVDKAFHEPLGNPGAADAPAALPTSQEAAPLPTNPSFEPNTITAAGLAGGRSAVPNSAPAAAAAPAPVPREVRFAEDNSDTIVRSMRAEVLPNGGSMRIRLDPPQLGALNVTVQIRDGLITAAFETTSDEATRLLGHSLNHLKSVLESQGVGVDRLHVQQAPKDQAADNHDPQHRREQEGQRGQQEQSARQEQERREMLRKMWRRIAGGRDPLDLTA